MAVKKKTATKRGPGRPRKSAATPTKKATMTAKSPRAGRTGKSIPAATPASGSPRNGAAEEFQLGDWLRDQRREQGWSRDTLAQKSGVSAPQIYNIESGRSTNPQDSTRKKLERALGTTIPDRIAQEAEHSEEIEGIGTLVDFDPYSKEDLPDQKGVYVFYDKTDRPIYVGMATQRSIAKRVSEHADKFWFKSPIVERASYIAISESKLCRQVEQVLIKVLKSNALINVQHVEGGKTAGD